MSTALDFPINLLVDVGMRGTPCPRNMKGTICMRAWTKSLVRFLQAEDGPTAVEYAVMLALIIVVCITAITSLGANANKTFSNVALNTAVSSS